MKEELLNLIDKIIGKKDIMRTPAWWVNHIFKKTLDYTDKVAENVKKHAANLDKTKEDKIPTVYIKEFTANGILTDFMKDSNNKFIKDVVYGEANKCQFYNSKNYKDVSTIVSLDVHKRMKPVGGNTGIYSRVIDVYYLDPVTNILYKVTFEENIDPVRIPVSSSLSTVYAQIESNDPTPTAAMKAANKAFYENALAGQASACIVKSTDTTNYESYVFSWVKVSDTNVECWFSRTLAFGALIYGTDARLLFTESNYENPSFSKDILNSGESYQILTSANVVNSLDSDKGALPLSANQGRILKEMIDNIPSGEGGGNAGGNIFRPLYMVTDGISYTEEQKAYNVETYNMLTNDEFVIPHIKQVMLNYEGVTDGACILSNSAVATMGSNEMLMHMQYRLNNDGTLSNNSKLFNITSLKQ